MDAAKVGACKCKGAKTLFQAVERGCAACCVKRIGEAKKTDKDGRTALMHAASTGKSNCVRVLASKEAGLRDKSGKTAAVMAIELGQNDCARLLLPYEGDERNEDGILLIVEHCIGKAPAFIRDFATQRLNCVCGLKSGSLLDAAGAGCCHCIWKYQDAVDEKDEFGNTALLIAAQKDSHACVKLLAHLQAGDVPEGRKTALMWEAERGHADTVRLLMEKEAGRLDACGRTALVLASLAGHDECVNLLAKAEGGKAGPGHPLPLVHAMERQNVRGVQELVMAEAGMCDEMGMTPLQKLIMMEPTANRKVFAEALLVQEKETSVSQITPLMVAAWEGDEKKVVEEKKKNYKNLKKQDIAGRTALMYAAIAGSRDCADRLFADEAGMKDERDLTATLIGGEMPFTPERSRCLGHLSQKRDEFETAKFDEETEQNKKAKQLLFYALAGDDEKFFSTVDDNCFWYADSDGINILMHIARKGSEKFADQVKEIANFVLHPEQFDNTEYFRKAFEAVDDCKRTVLMHAAIGGCKEMVQALVTQAGAVDCDDRTALMYAAAAGRKDCVELLLEKEGGAKDRFGRTALMYAAVAGNVEVVRLLLAKEGKKADNNSRTALMFAVLNGHADCVRELAAAEAKLFDKAGRSALMRAIQRGDAECVELLKKHEGSSANKSGLLPFHVVLEQRADAAYVRCLDILEEAGASRGGVTQLMEAAWRGDYRGFRSHLAEQRDQVDSVGRNALMAAATGGHPELVGVLAEGLLGKKDKLGHTALMLLCAGAQDADFPTTRAEGEHRDVGELDRWEKVAVMFGLSYRGERCVGTLARPGGQN